MNKTELRFDSRDGVTSLYAVRYAPLGTPRAVIQIVHGMQEHIGRYDAFARYLCDLGYVVTGEDHLGHGRSVPAGGTYGYFCPQDPATVVVRDVHRLKKMTQQAYPEVPYFILGHSMGSFILRNYIERYGTGIDGAIVVGTGYQSPLALAIGKFVVAFLTARHGDKSVSPFIERVGFGSYLKRIESPASASDWISRDPTVVSAFNRDEMCGRPFTLNGYGTLFTLISRAQKHSLIYRIPEKLPMIILSGEEDPVGHYGRDPRKVFDMYDRGGVGDLELKMYDLDRHEILNEPDRETVWKDIADWVDFHI